MSLKNWLLVGVPISCMCFAVVTGCDTRVERAAETKESHASGNDVGQVMVKSRGLSEMLAEVDAWYPRPKIPNPSSRFYRVTNVSSTGEITLESGLRFQLDGLSCTRDGIAALATRLLDASSQIAFVDDVTPAGTSPRAEIWLVTTTGG